MRPTISFAPTVRLKRLTPTSPPTRLVTAWTSSKVSSMEGTARGVPSPPPGPPHRAHDSLGQERDDQDQHEAVEHDVRAGAPADGGAGELRHRGQHERADDRPQHGAGSAHD